MDVLHFFGFNSLWDPNLWSCFMAVAPAFGLTIFLLLLVPIVKSSSAWSKTRERFTMCLVISAFAMPSVLAFAGLVHAEKYTERANLSECAKINSDFKAWLSQIISPVTPSAAEIVIEKKAGHIRAIASATDDPAKLVVYAETLKTLEANLACLRQKEAPVRCLDGYALE